MDILDKIKAECQKHTDCEDCKLFDGELCRTSYFPSKWDTDLFRNALNEPVEQNTKSRNDDSKVEIVVPEKWEETDFHWQNGKTDGIMRKQNKIIECLQQIKEMLDGKNV